MEGRKWTKRVKAANITADQKTRDYWLDLKDWIGRTERLEDELNAAPYAALAATLDAGEGSRPLGRVVCISPWNFPVAIFLGQIAASLAAGNAVLAKPPTLAWSVDLKPTDDYQERKEDLPAPKDMKPGLR